MPGPNPLARSILEYEDARIHEILKWTVFLKEVQQFAPDAKLDQSNDEFQLEGVDYEDPHFKRHLDAFLAGTGVDCEDPYCVVSEVHAL